MMFLKKQKECPFAGPARYLRVYRAGSANPPVLQATLVEKEGF